MRVIYSGASMCTSETYKRLLLLADEIAFNDRPSVTFGPRGEWGSVGMESPARQVVPYYSAKPVRLAVFHPPSGPVHDLYRRYLPVDLASPQFRRLFLEGLQNDARFANKFVPPEANYGWGKGAQVIAALASDTALRDVSLDIDTGITRTPYQMDDPQSRAETFRMLLAFASIELTTTMLVADDAGYIPVTDDPYLTQMLALRASHPAYIGGTAVAAPYLGIEIAKAVIPDSALQTLDIPTILNYRDATADVYKAWNVELNKIAAATDTMDPTRAQQELSHLMATEINPKIQEYRNEMKAVSNRMFGDVIKGIVTIQAPALLVGTMVSHNFIQAVATFATALAPAIGPAVINYMQGSAQAKRKHAISYLVDLAPAEK